MKKRTYILYFLLILKLGTLNSQADYNYKTTNPQVELNNGQIVKLFGYDVSEYEIDLEYLDVDLDNIEKYHLLCLAVSNCDYEVTHSLLKEGIDPNTICDIDHILTEVSFCEDSAVKIAEAFLRYGADINGADEENNSFLSYAISLDNLQLVDFILNKGASLTQRDTNSNMGCLPFHAIQSIEMLELLGVRQINLNDKCNNGRTLLHFAAKENLVELAEYLIQGRLVDKQAKDENGQTAYDYSIKFKSEGVRKLLE